LLLLVQAAACMTPRSNYAELWQLPCSGQPNITGI